METTHSRELEHDIIELKSLISKAERENVKQYLSDVVADLEKKNLRKVDSSDMSENTPKKAERESDVMTSALSSSAPTNKLPSNTVVSPHQKVVWVPLTTFNFDLGGSEKEFVTVDVILKEVGQIPRENITVDFTEMTFDVKVIGHPDGKNYRFIQKNLEKDIIPGESTFNVKKNKITVNLRKVKKGTWGYDMWSDLTSKRPRTAGDGENTSKDLNNLLKDLYDEGDDNTKKIIGESMMKNRSNMMGK